MAVETDTYFHLQGPANQGFGFGPFPLPDTPVHSNHLHKESLSSNMWNLVPWVEAAGAGNAKFTFSFVYSSKSDLRM